MSSKIYTKTGDKGETSLIGGTRLPKQHVRIEAYGNVDELNSYLGLIRDQIQDKNSLDTLLYIQDRLFTIGAHLANDPAKSKMKLPEMFEEDVTKLEKAIDEMDQQLPPMKSFVLPGGHTLVSHCHIARCVCRRSERAVLRLAESEKVDALQIRYLNRLSDYLFILSRYLSHQLKAVEIPWVPKYGLE